MSKVEINVLDYLSESEIKEICQDQLRKEVSEFFKSESNAERLISNLSYQIVFDEIDKYVPDSRKKIEEKTLQILNNIQNYSVFRDRSYGARKSLAYEIMEGAVRSNTQLINDKVKETIINKDYSEQIWDTFEKLADTFASNIYEISRLGREKSK